jgi:hypothetical protein
MNGIRLFVILCFCVWIQLSANAQPLLSWNFSQGSLGGSEIQNGNTVYLQLASNSDPWFFFRIGQVQNQRINFVLDHVPAAVFGDFYLPVVSYDQSNWSYCKNITVLPLDQDHVRFTFEVTFAEERAWIAFEPPFPNPQLDVFTASLVENPFVNVDSICESVEKKMGIPLITITNPEGSDESKNRVLIISREGGNDPATTWMTQGMIRFLLSDDPAAQAVLRRCIVYTIPIFDRDAVEMGVSGHPLDTTTTVNWKNTWNEKDYSFYEQRVMKSFLQNIHDSGARVDLLLRLQSNHNGQDHIHRESVRKEKEEAQDQLTVELVEKKYLPWYTNIERQPALGTLSEAAHKLFPDMITASFDVGLAYKNQMGLPYSLPKTTDDLYEEASLLMYAVAEALGVPASDPPPYLHAAEVYRMDGNRVPSFHVRCVYRDLQNRPPEYVRAYINDQVVDLQPADSNQQNYNQGVLYTGFVNTETRINTHYFTASNGSKTVRIPEVGARPGPFSVPVLKR